MQGHAELLEVIDALSTPGGFAGGLNGGQEQGDQHADDADHHEQLDQCKGSLCFIVPLEERMACLRGQDLAGES